MQRKCTESVISNFSGSKPSEIIVPHEINMYTELKIGEVTLPGTEN